MKYLIVLTLFLVSCDSSKDGTPVSVQGAKADFKVKLLFTKDGCSVYRFYDERLRYFTNCSGSTSSEYSEQVGKTRKIVNEDIPGR